jgi:hypothetical protein
VCPQKTAVQTKQRHTATASVQKQKHLVLLKQRMKSLQRKRAAAKAAAKALKGRVHRLQQEKHLRVTKHFVPFRQFDDKHTTAYEETEAAFAGIETALQQRQTATRASDGQLQSTLCQNVCCISCISCISWSTTQQ